MPQAQFVIHALIPRSDCDWVQVNLQGGYYDAGDNVKFNLPMAFSITLLAWNVVEFGDNLRSTGQLQNALNNIRWGTDYLLRCYTNPTELYVMVSCIDHMPM